MTNEQLVQVMITLEQTLVKKMSDEPDLPIEKQYQWGKGISIASTLRDLEPVYKEIMNITKAKGKFEYKKDIITIESKINRL